MELPAFFYHLNSRQWLALAISGFTPRQLAACAPLGVDGLFSPQTGLHHLRQHRVRATTAEKWLAFVAGEGTGPAQVEKTLAWLETHPDCSLVHCAHASYPQLLLATNSPPLLLYVRGNLEVLSMQSIAMVGARNPTLQGKRNAALFAEQLAAAGLLVVSGLALGIDAACHGAALNTGKTIAVMGTGIDSIYPKKHQALAASILESGALVSEFPLGSKPLAVHFPRRNRIISGISLGVIVVEASIKSGGLITARYALDANREVFAIPGSTANPLSRGCHALIKEGAALVEDPAEVLEVLAIAMPPSGTTGLVGQSSQLSPDLRALLEAMGYEPCSVDGLCEALGLSAARVNSALIELEMEGYVQQVPGGYVRLGRLA